MCDCLSANLSPSGEFELCEECRLEEERENDDADEQSVHLTGLTLRQKEEVLQIIIRALSTGSA